VSAAVSSAAAAPAVGVVVAAVPDEHDERFHSELRPRHIGTRRRDVDDDEDVLDASATDGDRAARRRRRAVLVSLMVGEQSLSVISSAATHGILPA